MLLRLFKFIKSVFDCIVIRRGKHERVRLGKKSLLSSMFVGLLATS